MAYDKKIIFDTGDGPEGICVYTSEDEGAVDWADTTPAVYIEIGNYNTSFKIRLTMQKVVDDLLAALSKSTVVPSA